MIYHVAATSEIGSKAECPLSVENCWVRSILQWAGN